MSDYVGQPPHGGERITHHELCLGDCGHWDCMGCCYCPEEADVETVATLTATKDQEWLAWWFSDQLAQAKSDVLDKITKAVEALHPLAFDDEDEEVRKVVLATIKEAGK